MPTYSCSTFRTLQVSFASPTIPPANGYVVKWRPVGTTEWNTVNQNQNPVTIAGVPGCFNIEGTIQANCGGGNLGSPVSFAVSSSSAECRSIRLLDTGAYTYVPCNSSQPGNVNNFANSPTTVCAQDGTVSGGTFTDLNQACTG
jgi:hypothetical protein